MPQLQLRIGGRWAPAIGPWGDLQWSTCLQGSDEASWTMDHAYRRLSGRPSVRIYDGPEAIWGGVLSQLGSEDGRYVAQGLWKAAYNYPAIDTGNAATPVTQDAIDGAISRGLPWTRSTSFNLGSPTAMTASLQGEVPKLGDMLDTWADRHNRYWAVTPLGEVYHYTRPTSPDIVVTPDQRMTPADDDYRTKLWAVRKDNTGAKVLSGPVEDTDAAARWVTPREDVIDLTEYGNMTDPVAVDVLTGILAKYGSRIGWANPITVAPERVTTGGGIPAYTTVLHGGMLARVVVPWDDTSNLNGRTYTEILVNRTVHSSSSSTVTLEPVGLAGRDLSHIIERLGRAARRSRRH